jgi:hypothetical protein
VESAIGESELGSLREALEAELRRVPDRLRALPVTRLAAPLPPYPSVAEAARAVAQRLADAAAGVEDRSLPEPPGYRVLPELADRACGDQIVVTGTDLLLASDGVAAGTRVWSGVEQAAVDDVVRRAVEDLAGLRRAL